MERLAAGIAVLQRHGACSAGYENPTEGEQSHGADRPRVWQVRVEWVGKNRCGCFPLLIRKARYRSNCDVVHVPRGYICIVHHVREFWISWARDFLSWFEWSAGGETRSL